MVNDGAPLTVGKNDTMPAAVLFPIERFGVPTRTSGEPSLLASATRTNVPKFDFGLMEPATPETAWFRDRTVLGVAVCPAGL